MIISVFDILQESGLKQNNKVICAVSGGIDSVVLLHILNRYGLDCIVAHCNFQLRGEESDRDEDFVRNLAKEYGYKSEIRLFNTLEFAESKKISVQMAARELRFTFFDELLEKYNCNYIALGHNSDDQIETVLTNLVRGTGIRGLTGMSEISGKYLRPILNVSRKEIEEYAKQHNVDYCQDSTNETTKYSRNKLRHIVIPAFEEINTAARNNILKSIDVLKDNEAILNKYVDDAFNQCVTGELDEDIYIDLNKLRGYASAKTVLFEILLRLGLPINLATDSIELLDSQTGKYCENEELTVLNNRDVIKISKNTARIDPRPIKIVEADLACTIKSVKTEYKFTIEDISPEYKPQLNSDVAYLDYDKLKFPLLIRQKKDGDKFKPLGMSNYKKLKDFFIDMKIPINQKQDIDLFVSGDDIVWVSCMRIDDRYKITGKTTKILKIQKVI